MWQVTESPFKSTVYIFPIYILSTSYKDTFKYISCLDENITDGHVRQVITANKTFADEVTVPSGQLEIYGLVNGYNMTNDFLDKITDQIVTGKYVLLRVVLQNRFPFKYISLEKRDIHGAKI